MAVPQAFTGRKRELRNRASVKLADSVSHVVITIGGIGTIIAVSTVFFFLAWVVGPLFSPPEMEGEQAYQANWASEPPVRLGVDEYKVLGWVLHGDGVLRVFRLDNGALLNERPLVNEGPAMTATSFSISGGSVALGFADGSVRLGKIDFKTSFPPRASVPPKVGGVKEGDVAEFDGGLLERTPQGALRKQEVVVKFGDPIQIGTSPVRMVDHFERDQGPIFTTLTEDGQLQINTVRERENLLTGKITYTANSAKIPYEPRDGEPASHLVLSGLGDSIYVAWKDGVVRRFDTRSLSDVRLAEEIDVVEDPNAALTVFELLLGRQTLVAGQSDGAMTAWFRIRKESTVTSDGTELTLAHRLEGPDSAVSSVGMSTRTRMLAAGYANGHVRVFHVTSNQQMVDVVVDEKVAVSHVRIAPKDDGLVAISGAKLWMTGFDPKHPEASLTSLFRPVWYEGYPEPEHVWQSGGGTADLEPKLGLMPLIFGTIKATFYSMLFGCPLALLAAIYTSEFLHPRTRAKIKPTIELMASLPSVVLGFLAALVFAPILEKVVPAMLASFLTVPLAFLFCSYLWQLIPYRAILKLQRWRFLVILFVALPIGVLSSFVVGPIVESLYFAGDVKAWLNGQIGNGMGGWMLLALPAASVATAIFMGTTINPWIRRLTGEWSRAQMAIVSLVKFLIGAAAVFLVASLVSWGLAQAGLDPRGTYVDTFIQRNALVVGFIMGFAIIPIIYTIADDALSTVPGHLRSGSLGCGATPWQTAFRIVIPTAMSGLFSAMMIGLGRAVGETMIVLMAAGNTPVMDWNIFNGFRTLSANIAVELPEAARDSTHYRTLFLAALTLFILTFIVNTGAEIVRLRFRKRAYQL